VSEGPWSESGVYMSSEQHQNAVLRGINRLFSEALACDTDKELGRICLAVAEDVTGSKFGFIGEIDAGGSLNCVAISDPGWEACRISESDDNGTISAGFEIHGIYGRVLLDEKSFYTNDPASHPDSIGLPEGHPPLLAFLGAPLIHAGKTIGMVGLGNREGGYSDQDMEALEALTPAIVQLFVRRRSEIALQEINRRLELLSETANRLLVTDNPQVLVQSLCEHVMEALGCHIFFNFLVDEERGCLHLNACAGIPEDAAKSIEWLEFGTAVRGCAARDGCRIIAEDIFNTPDVRTELVKGYGVQAYACHPLLAQGEKVIGTLSFGSKTKAHFVDNEIELMRAVADQVATAMERIRLLNTERQRAEELARLNRILRAHSNSSHAMMRATDEPAYLQEVCRIIIEDCGHAMAWIGLAENDEARSVRPVAYSGFEQGYLETLGISWADTERGRGPTGTAIRTGKPCVCQDVLTNPEFEPWRAEAVKRGYASSMVVPLLADDKAFGAITVYSREPNSFSEEEIKLLSQLADDVAFGIGAIRTQDERRRAEEALRESEESFRTMANAIPQLAWMADPDGYIFWYNKRWYEYTGTTPEQMKGWGWQSVHDPDVLPKVLERWKASIEKGEPFNMEFPLKGADGKFRVFLTRGVPIKDSEGRVTRWFGTNTDVSEARELEAHKREFYRRTIQAATEGKLLISESEEIERLSGPQVAAWKLGQPVDVEPMRDGIAGYAAKAGMDAARVYDFTGCAVEAAANAVKHAGGGVASLHAVDSKLIFKVVDNGSGIGALALPDIALTKGYTTAVSLGMGYKVIIRFADKVYLATGPEGTAVAVEMKLHREDKLPGVLMGKAGSSS